LVINKRKRNLGGKGPTQSLGEKAAHAEPTSRGRPERTVPNNQEQEQPMPKNTAQSKKRAIKRRSPIPLRAEKGKNKENWANNNKTGAE